MKFITAFAFSARKGEAFTELCLSVCTNHRLAESAVAPAFFVTAFECILPYYFLLVKYIFLQNKTKIFLYVMNNLHKIIIDSACNDNVNIRSPQSYGKDKAVLSEIYFGGFIELCF